MEIRTITVEDFVRGNPHIQEYYQKQGYQEPFKSIMRSEIEAICQCGYLTLKPRNAFEDHNGGITVKRSRVTIIDDKTGQVIKRLRPKLIQGGRAQGYRDYDDIMTHCNCNACVNGWK